MTLESCLDLILDSLELTWTIRHESLVITTPEEAEYRPETRVYPVADLVLIDRNRKANADFNTLIDLIETTIAPDAWDSVGGPGGIAPEPGSLSLVISQTWRTHRQIEPLLTTLRTARELQGIESVKTELPRTSTVKPPRRYHATANSAWQRPRVYEE